MHFDIEWHSKKLVFQKLDGVRIQGRSLVACLMLRKGVVCAVAKIVEYAIGAFDLCPVRVRLVNYHDDFFWLRGVANVVWIVLRPVIHQVAFYCDTSYLR